MDESNLYAIFPIALPPSDKDLEKYVQLRLLGLKTNPEAFGSTFERESQNTQQEWKARIDNKERFTMIARADAEGEWIGTASILTPELIRAHTGDATMSAYAVVGMWVHPDHRRRGVAKRLVESGINWVRARTEGMSDEQRRITLEVHRHNENAKALYEGLGFMESTNEECEDPKRIPMFFVAK
ncbi:acyl-CoA N-acyltransferase [Mycena metata]|uniref:Acyl-CoA N-acyltransferase n=1 Tax=Mycena metata TaxID=1033252 RepID=A0AAD7NUI1_9AGAR|nr:acyl-CoA N-acyltransferase [Mycena metata]